MAKLDTNTTVDTSQDPALSGIHTPTVSQSGVVGALIDKTYTDNKVEIINEPGGNTTEIQLNANGKFAGDSGLTFNSSTDQLNVKGNLNAGGWIKGKIRTNTFNFYLMGGTDGQALVTDGAGNLRWANMSVGSYSNSNVVILLSNFGSNTISTTGKITADGGGLSNVPYSNITGLGNIVTINKDGNASNILYGNGVFAQAPAVYSNSNVVSLLSNYGSNIITTTGNITVGNLIGNGQFLTSLQGANVTGYVSNAIMANTALSVDGANVSGAVNYANTANAVAVANVIGIGNIATLSLNGNSSQVLYGNGQWASSGGIQSKIANGTSNVNIAISSGAVEVTAGTQHWAFGTDGTLTAPNDSQIVPAGNNFNIYTNGLNGAVQFFTDVTGNNHNWAFDGYGYTQLPFSQGFTNTAVITSVGAGNIMLQAGAGPTQNFLFGSDGNLTLPTNTSSINYANGDPYGVAGANTGNVTFDDINIIGTGNLHLQPDPANTGSYLDIFLTSGPDLHLVASAGANLILGKDDGPNVMTSWDGNAYIQSWSLDTGNVGGIWTFGGDGNLTFPDNSGSSWPINQQRFGMGNVGAWLDGQWTIGEFSGNGVSGQVGIRIDPGIEGNTGITLPSQADSVTQPVTIYNYGGGNVKIDTDYSTSWTFDTTGLLTLPSGNVTIGSVLGGDAILANNIPFGIVSYGNAGSTVGQWMDDLLSPTALSAIYINGPGAGVGDVQILTGEVTPNANIFNFTANGVFSLAKGNSTIESVPNNAGDGSGLSTLNLVPDDTTGDDRYLIIDPTGPAHLHLRAGGLQDASNVLLYLGGEQTYVQVDDGYHRVTIGSYDISNATGYNWRFDFDGNLVLPGNTFAVKYANGTQVPLGGGGNIGNVTFNDQVVQGTGDEYGGSGLYLAPGANSTGNLQYLRVRGGDYPTHIHLDTGNNNYFDQYFGADFRYVKLEANGNIVINADDDNGNSATWTFDTTGKLQVPGDVFANGIASPAPALYGFSSLQVYDQINVGGIVITSSDGTNGQLLTTYGNGVTYWSTVSGGGGSYGDGNVATFLASFGSNTISTTGNISAGNVELTGNLTVNGSPIYGAPASYAKYTRTTTQTGITTSTVVVCNVLENSFGSDISVNTSTGNVTLTAGRTYRVRGTAGSLVSSGSQAGGAWRWYNVTSSSYIGGIGTSISPAASNYNTGAIDTAEVVITPAVTTVLQLQMVAVSNMNTIGGIVSIEGGYPWIDIEVIGGQAPITGFTTTGNVTGNYFIGNGSQLTGIPASYTNSNVSTFLASFGSNTISTTGNISVGNIGVASITATANISTTGYFISGNQATGGFQLGNSNSRLKSGDSNSYMTMGQNPAIYPDTAASALAGVLIGGSGYLLGNNGSRNITLNYGGVSGIVGLQSNVQVGTAGSGTVLVPGTVTTGVNSILAGPTFTPLANTMAGFVSNVNSYTQLTIQNKSTGTDATTDFVATADNGSDTVNYLDLGIINSGYDNLTPTNSLGNIVYAADSYLYAQGNISNTSQSGGNLAIGTTVAGKSVKIFAGGNTASNIVATISNTGIVVNGNVSATNLSGNISITGNVTGTSPNVSLVAGSFTATFDNTGLFTLPTMGGDEGGEINFGIPATNTTLSGTVKLDVYRNQIRFFDGSTKGAYIDLSQAATGVGTLLNNRVSGLVNAGTFVTMDNIKATVTSSGNRGLSLAAVSGTFAYSIGGNFATTGGSGGAATTGTMTTTATSSIFNWGFPNTAETSTYILTDTTNNRCYRITLQIGASYNNNSIIIERLI